MNTQLKKGDKCNSPWGVVTVNKTLNGSDITTVGIDGADGIYRMVHRDDLTRIPSHAERMQAILDIAWDAENTLDENDTVSLKVGQLADFARHYCELCQALGDMEIEALSHAEILRQQGKKIVRILKGEP
jgi:hypothetical protein